MKTYQLVDDPAIDDVISWNEDGSTFVVWRPAEFAGELLPKYFKHNNFSSFVRQLNTYGFRKIVADRWEFANDSFKRGEKRLLCRILRRKNVAPVAQSPVEIPMRSKSVLRSVSPVNSGEEQAVSSSSNSPALACYGAGDLREENERLRQENERLSKELAEIKGIYNDVLHLMSKLAAGDQCIGGERWAVAAALPRLDLMAAEREFAMTEPEMDAGMKIFGVAIGSKRAREVDCCKEGRSRPAVTAG